MLELVNAGTSKHVSDTVYNIFITLEYGGAMFEKQLEISEFLSVCKLNTHYHPGKTRIAINVDRILNKTGESGGTKTIIFLALPVLSNHTYTIHHILSRDRPALIRRPLVV